MKNRLIFLPLLLSAVLLTGCGDDDAFSQAGGAGSGTNIVAYENFQMLFDDTNPPVISSDGLSFDGGIKVVVTIHASDRLRLATVGATVYLDVEWGTLSATSCVIDSSGSCNITWGSNANIFDPAFPADFEVAFTTWVLGEETFIDLNFNGFFDNGDIFDTNTTAPPSNPVTPPGADTPGPFLDLDHSGDYTLNIDKVLIPGNSNNLLTPEDGLYSGQNCAHPTLCSPNTLIYISSSALLPIQESATP